MALHHYPVDSQECDIRLLSYSHPADELELHWVKSAPLDYNKDILLGEMDLERMEHQKINETYANGNLLYPPLPQEWQ